MRTRVEIGSAYELLGTCLASVLDIEAGREIRVPGLSRADQAAFGDVAKLGRDPVMNLIGFVAGATSDPSAQGLISGLRSLEPRELLRVLVGYYRRAVRRATDPATIDAALAGERVAIKAFLDSSFPDAPYWHASMRALTGAGRHRMAAAAVDALDHLSRSLPAYLEACVERARPGVEEAREALHRMPTELAIEALAVGGEIAFARAIGQDDVVVGPRGDGFHVYAIVDYGSTLVVSYPAADPTTGMPPARLVAIGQALGDERRLRVLRALAAGPLTVAELAARMGVPRSSLNYHLSILRTSGLVGWAVDDAEAGPLALRQTALGEIEAGLAGYLGLLPADSDRIRLSA